MNKLNEIAKEFINQLNLFEFTFTGYDKVWNFVFPLNSRKWVHTNIVLYNKKYFINELIHQYPSIEIDTEKEFEVVKGQEFGFSNTNIVSINAWIPVFEKAVLHLKQVQKNWLVENTAIHKSFPLKYRKGIVPHNIINECFPTLINVRKLVGENNAKQIIELIESNYFRDTHELRLETLTANKYFEYCKVAYNSVTERQNTSINDNGKALYQTYADGRHEGLLDIDGNSSTDFASWLDGSHPKKTTGGHPWEILRGGNTTHISLRVSRPDYQTKKGFVVKLAGDSLVRLKECIQIALALHKAGLPFVLQDANEIRLRLLAQDNIGIVPENQSLHRANKTFKQDNVIDVIYLSDIKEKLKAIKPFITWEPLKILKSIAK